MQEKRELYYTVRLTAEERQRLAVAAQESCTSGGTIVRLALKRFFDEAGRLPTGMTNGAVMVSDAHSAAQ